MSKPIIRCAIYTRKSSDEGLEQGFNSLDAQYEACAAYIASQRHEGWRAHSSRYDDGGISGGTLERPALRRLLLDIDAGRIDMVVVYKIDRLTRSLPDFARLVERLESADCSFVSVTQAFNTSSSMGRLTLNVLLSFAQFEREVTAERIRDKIAASKRKGLWMGGLAPIGYDAHPDPARRELVINPAGAETVRQLFDLYLQEGCLNATASAARRRGLRSKRRVFASGRVQGGTVLSRGQIHKILTNPVYRGIIRHKDKTWPGTHAEIIETQLWDQVQARLQAAGMRRRGVCAGDAVAPTSPLSAAPLLGTFRDETGDRLTPTHTQRRDRRFRYYVSNRLLTGKRDPAGWRLPARSFEHAVSRLIADHLETRAKHHAVLITHQLASAEDAARKAEALAATIRTQGIETIAPAIETGEVSKGRIHIRLDPAHLAGRLDLTAEDLDRAILEIDAPFTARRRGVETKIIAGDLKRAPDPTLLRGLQRAHRWTGMLKAGKSIQEIARAEALSANYVARILPLATLSPKIQAAITTGNQPIDLTLETLVRSRLPLGWFDQERLFGFAA